MTLSLFSSVLLAAALAGQAAPSIADRPQDDRAPGVTWKRVVPPGLDYAVEMPGAPETRVERLATLAGEIEARVTAARQSGFACAVVVVGVPESAAAAPLANEVIPDAVALALNAEGFRESAERRDLSPTALPTGVAVSGTAGDASVDARVFLAGASVFLAAAAGDASSRARFLESFAPSGKVAPEARNEGVGAPGAGLTNSPGVHEPPPPPAPPPNVGSSPFRVSGGVLAGKAVTRVQPEYPRLARQAGVEGSVVVEVRVSKEGEVTTAKAVSGHPLLRPASEEAAAKWRYAPTLLSGTPVEIIGTVTFNFRRAAEGPAHDLPPDDESWPARAKHHLSLGVSFVRSGSYRAAVDACSQAVLLAPDLGEAYTLLGHALVGAGELDAAGMAVDEAVRRAPDSAFAHYGLAWFRFTLGKLPEAIEAARDATARDPNWVPARWLLARALVDAGRAEEALPEYEALVKLDAERAAELRERLQAAGVAVDE
jgi:protein TonB